MAHWIAGAMLSVAIGSLIGCASLPRQAGAITPRDGSCMYNAEEYAEGAYVRIDVAESQRDRLIAQMQAGGQWFYDGDDSAIAQPGNQWTLVFGCGV